VTDEDDLDPDLRLLADAARETSPRVVSATARTNGLPRSSFVLVHTTTPKFTPKPQVPDVWPPDSAAGAG
jgi:hypothetical protein